MKLKVDNREKKLIKLLDAYVKQYNFKNIEITIEKLDLGDFIICDDDDNGDVEEEDDDYDEDEDEDDDDDAD